MNPSIKEEKRKRILLAAEELLAARSSHEVKLDEVAELAGIGKGTIYLYFKDKEDLFFEVAMSGFGELCDLVRGAVSGVNVSFHQELLKICGSISAFFEQRRALSGMMQAGQHRCQDLPAELRDRWFGRRRELVQAIGDVIASGQQSGQIRADVPPEVLGDYLLGMLRTRTRDLRDAPAKFRSDRFIVRLFCEGAGIDLEAISEKQIKVRSSKKNQGPGTQNQKSGRADSK